MLFTDTTFIGIDIPGARRPLTYAALDADLDIIGIGAGSADDVLAFVNGQDKAFVAVTTPRSPNQGYMADDTFRDGLNPRPKPGRWDRWRVAEYALRQHWIKVRRTPGDAANAPKWMRIGFSIYSELAQFGFRPYPPNFDPQQAQGNGKVLYSLECYPHAAFTALLKGIPLNRDSLEGRIQRQLVLYVNNVEVPNPMQVFEEITQHRLLSGDLMLDDLLEPTQLDALVAAFTAREASKGEVTLLGHPLEGQVALPTVALQARYT